MKKVMTVLGPVEADKLGHILPHEHILMEFPEPESKPLYPELRDRSVTMDLLGKLRRDIWSCRDNYRLDEQETAVQEIQCFREKGGGTLVDVTPIGLGRNVSALREISQRAGVHIVATTGYYVHRSYLAQMEKYTLDNLAEFMTREIETGIEDTGIKAGIIGVIGIRNAMHPNEEKVLRASARVHKRTDVPIYIHQYGGAELEKIHSVLVQEEVSPEKVILCHMCSVSENQRLWAANHGYYLGIDSFGKEYYTDALSGYITRDPDKIQMVKYLIEKGHLRQILISQDVTLKILLKKYGGWGYEHILVNIKPFMLRQGIPIKSVDSMLYYNPMRALAYLE